MFAIALWDTQKRELWLVRDRIGIKPLYYAIQRGRIVFASEIKAILNDPHISREINENGLFDFLSFLSVPAPDTLFAGINKLPGGTWMRVSANGQSKQVRYWDVLDHTQSLSGLGEDEIAERLLAELKRAVDLRKVSDVPVGVFLSGGIDSSTNAALFSEGSSRPVKTFSIGYQGEYESYQNELDYARLAAEHCGADYYQQLLTFDDLMSFLPQLVYLQDEPIADPVCMPVYYVSKLARENGVIVCHVGEGADELFCGYDSWKMINRLQKLDGLPMPRIIKKAGLRGLSALNRSYGFDYEWLRRGAMGLPVFWGGAESYTHERKRSLVPRRLFEQFSDEGSWKSIEPIYKRYQQKASEKSYLNWMTYLDLNNRLPELLLMRVDKMSMASSVEARVPFLDHKLVELAMSIQSDLKIRRGVGKYILRKAVRNTIPDAIIDRQKQGFGLPLQEWFQGEFTKHATEKLRLFCSETGLLNYQPIEEMLHMKKPDAVWPMLNVALWWDCYFSRGAQKQASYARQGR
jgi:asparagine synthase (glutamine-hydrolysing)